MRHAAIAVLASLLSGSASFGAEPEAQGLSGSSTQDVDRICNLIATSAERYQVPEPFLARLLWQESKFNENAVDTTGGRGIAKMMPVPARWAELDNPFDSEEAIPAAAAYIDLLRDRFGNLGLAAAAYDIGEQALSQWMVTGGIMPAQTENYVLEVTGQAAATFLDEETNPPLPPLKESSPFMAACKALPTVVEDKARTIARKGAWEVQVAGNFRQSAVVRQWGELTEQVPEAVKGLEPAVGKWVSPLGDAGVYAAKVFADTRDEANRICNELRASGESCVVLRNRSELLMSI